MLGSDYTTTGAQADVAINTAATVRYNGSNTATFYGIVAGTNGQIIHLHNASTAILTLSHQSTSEATLANRIITGTGADLALASNSSVTLQYDTTASRWRVIGGSGGGTPGGSTTQVQFNNSGAFGGDSKMTWDNTNKQLQVGTGAATPVSTNGTVAAPVMNVIPQAAPAVPGSGLSSGMVLLNTLTASNSASLSDTTSITSAYTHYMIEFDNIMPATASTNCQVQIHSGGAYKTTGYVASATRSNAGGGASFQSVTTAIPCNSFNNSDQSNAEGISGYVEFINPAWGHTKWFGLVNNYSPNASSSQMVLLGGFWNGAGSIDGFQVSFSSGNITSGNVRVYGWN
jgi:hypothetical protein